MTTAATVLAWMTLALWLYLLIAHGRFWRAAPSLPPVPAPDAADRTAADAAPSVTVVVPARDEAAILPSTLPTLLHQDYPGDLDVILVDDASTDGTGPVAEKLGAAPGARPLTVVRGDGPPPGWAGKVAAMARAAALAEQTKRPDYLLFTDADIAHPADSVRRLVAHARSAETGSSLGNGTGSAWAPDADGAAEASADSAARGLDLVSLMAHLNTATGWERAIVPAFVYSFFQLYPPARSNRPGSRVAAAAGGCMLVRAEALRRAGGLEKIAAARIDDVALAGLIKRSGGRTWLGVTTEVRSLRPYPRLADLWDMIARSAYTQLRYSPVLLAGTVLGLLFMYAAPPVLGIAALIFGAPAAAVPALAAWAVMSASYIPILRLYRLAPWRAPLLPGVMMLYGAMTVDSARRHARGRGGAWKGRTA